MSESDPSADRLSTSNVSERRSRLFWASMILPILAILLICAALITVAAARS